MNSVATSVPFWRSLNQPSTTLSVLSIESLMASPFARCEGKHSVRHKLAQPSPCAIGNHDRHIHRGRRTASRTAAGKTAMDFDPVLLARVQFGFTIAFHIIF